MKKVSRQRRRSLRAACAAVGLLSGSSSSSRASTNWLPIMEECEQRQLFVALTEVPVLNSRPGANAKLYLDFNGSDAIPNWLGIDVPATPALDRDGNANDFNADELTLINRTWQRVAEKYSPFNINVTTVEPGNRADRITAAIIIGGEGEWLGAPAGGVAPLGGFTNGGPNVGFAFGNQGWSERGLAEGIAHEAGHLFGLQHHSTFNPDGTKDQEYDPGDFFIAPIMGVSYYSERGLWYKAADTEGPNVIQDDLAVLSNSNNGFGYRVDDYGPNLFGAQQIVPTSGSAFSYNGVIERTGDVDAFTFSANSGTLSLSLDVAPFGAMLDASIKVVDAFGTVVGQKATSALDETLTITGLAAGTYIIQVSGSGNYGDLGQYTLHGNLPGGGIPAQSDHLLIQGTDLADNITITLVEGSYQVDVNGEIDTVDPNTIKQFDILAGDGDDVITIGPGVCHMYCLAGGGNDTVTGSEFADTITGSAGTDIIYGMDGDDRLAGSGGHDILVGMNGRDRLYGDDGNDQLKGGGGVDRLYGGEGHDILVGESSADKMYGEVGNDTLVGGNGTDLLNGGDGLDFMYGGNDDDYFYSRDNGFDLLSGGSGNDSAESEDADVRDTLENLIT